MRLPMLRLVSPLIPFGRYPMWLVAFAMTTDYHRSIDKDGLGFMKVLFEDLSTEAITVLTTAAHSLPDVRSLTLIFR